jgi:hypothetical protein
LTQWISWPRRSWLFGYLTTLFQLQTLYSTIQKICFTISTVPDRRLPG